MLLPPNVLLFIRDDLVEIIGHCLNALQMRINRVWPLWFYFIFTKSGTVRTGNGKLQTSILPAW